MKIYIKAHFECAKDLYDQIKAFYSADEILRIDDNVDVVIVYFK